MRKIIELRADHRCFGGFREVPRRIAAAFEKLLP
jgi:hypothetical protein